MFQNQIDFSSTVFFFVIQDMFENLSTCSMKVLLINRYNYFIHLLIAPSLSRSRYSVPLSYKQE